MTQQFICLWVFYLIAPVMLDKTALCFSVQPKYQPEVVSSSAFTAYRGGSVTRMLPALISPRWIFYYNLPRCISSDASCSTDFCQTAQPGSHTNISLVFVSIAVHLSAWDRLLMHPNGFHACQGPQGTGGMGCVCGSSTPSLKWFGYEMFVYCTMFVCGMHNLDVV